MKNFKTRHKSIKCNYFEVFYKISKLKNSQFSNSEDAKRLWKIWKRAKQNKNPLNKGGIQQRTWGRGRLRWRERETPNLKQKQNKTELSTTLWCSSFEQTSYWVSESWLYYKMFLNLSVLICEVAKIKTDHPKTLSINTWHAVGT